LRGKKKETVEKAGRKNFQRGERGTTTGIDKYAKPKTEKRAATRNRWGGKVD